MNRTNNFNCESWERAQCQLPSNLTLSAITSSDYKSVQIVATKSLHRIMVLSHLRSFCRRLCTILATTVFLACLTVLLPVWVIIILCRSLVWILAKVFRPDLDCFVTKQNALFAVYPPTVSHNSLNILTFLIVKGQQTAERNRQLFKERVQNQTDLRNRLIYLRLKQFWTSFLGYAFWKTDENFSVDLHVREYDYTGDLSIPCPCQQSDILKLFGKLVATPWAKNRSPWEILIVNNFIEEGCFEPSTCLIVKINHVLCDGYSIVNLLEQLYNTKMSMLSIRSNRREFTCFEKLGLVFRIPYDLVESIIPVLSSKTVFNNKLSGQVICSLSPPVPVSLIKEIKDHYKVSYAAVIQCAIQGVIVKALTSAKLVVPKNLLCQYILPIPNHPGGIVCHSNGMAVKFSCEGVTSGERLYKMGKTLKDLSNSTATIGTLGVMQVYAHSPIIVKRYFFSAMSSVGLSYAVSNFPVTTSQVFFDGLELSQLAAFTDMGMYKTGIAILTAGVNNQQVFCFSTDKNVFGSEEIASNLGSLILEEIQDLAREIV